MQEWNETPQGATGEDPVVRVDYQALVEDLPELVCRLTPSLVPVYVNRAYCRYFGKSREELIGRSIAQLLPGEDLALLTADLASLSPENPAGVIEHRVELPEGELRWHQWTIRAVYDGEGGLAEYQMVGRDVDARRLAEEALGKSEERFRSLIESVPDIVAVFDADGTIRYDNTALERTLGCRPGERVGSSNFDYVHPDDVELAKKTFAKAVETPGTQPPVQFRVRHADGSWRHLDTVRTNLLDDPSVRGIMSVARDITEREGVERELRHQKAYSDALSETAVGLMNRLETDELLNAIITRAASLVGTDHGFVNLVEPGESEMETRVGLGFFSKLVGDRIGTGVGLAGKVFQTGEPFAVEDYTSWPGRRTDIESEPVYALAGVPLGSGTRVVGVIGLAYVEKDRNFGADEMGVLSRFAELASVALDNARLYESAQQELDERKRTEKNLRESEELHRALFEQSVESIYVYDPDTRRILEANAAFGDLIGYTSDELLEMNLYDFVAHERGEIDRNVERNVREGKRFAHERRYRRKDGSLIQVAVSATSISYRGSEAVCCVARDVTERREVEEKLRRNEKRFRSLVRSAPDVITVNGFDGTIHYASPAIERVLGYRPDELVGSLSYDLAHPDDLERAKEAFAEALDKPGRGVPLEAYRIRHKDGSWRFMETVRTNLLDDPAVGGVVINSRDVTGRKEAEEALKESEERYRAVMEQSAEAIYLHGTETKRVLESNAAFQEMLGYTAEELSGMEIYDFIAHDKRDIDAKAQLDTVAEKRFVGERKYRHKDGALLDVSVSATLIPYRGRESVCVVVRDVTHRKVLEEQLRHRALHDSLTELPNRALFLDRLEHALSRFERTSEALAVLFVDLDDFKLVNDSLGHDAGNDLLVEIAGRLQSCVRQGDTVARLFGDEFAVLLEAPAGMENVLQVTERIMELLQKPCDLNGRMVYANTSVGIAFSDSARDHPQDLLRRADLAMYAAKGRGKARYEIFSPSMDTRVLERMEMENALRRAVENEEGFEVHYQPIVDLPSGEIVGLEALARWSRPESGPVDTTEFIQIAESTGLIQPIGRRVLQEACQQARGWREQRPDRPPLLSVNFSASQFSRQSDLVSEILKAAGLTPDSLQLEITERSVMDNAEYSLEKLRRLRDLGVQFAIDDYGTGYSCLQYLKLMPVDSLKIDRSFIAGLVKDSGDAAIVAGTIDLAHALGLKVVAEGVETAEQLERLKELGCDMAQGFYLFRPGRAEEITELLNGAR